jgi:hypothetical protein
MIRTALLAALSLPLAVAHAQIQQVGAPGSPASQMDVPPEPATGLILGRVLDGDTGSPVNGAIVSTTIPALNPGNRAAGQPPAGGPAPRLVGTNGDGDFVFSQLPRGFYMLTATAPGYSVGQSGQRRIGGPAQAIVLQVGQRLGDVTIRMWKYGVITGTVVDDLGEPSVNTQVRVLRVTVNGAQKRLTAGNYVQTDDRGVFRAAGLLPGDYVVSVPQSVTSLPSTTVDTFMEAVNAASAGGAPGSPPPALVELQRALAETGAPPPTNLGITVGSQQILPGRSPGFPSIHDGTLAAFPTTYFGGTSSAADAATITLVSGQERTGVDIQIRAIAAVAVSGHVMGPDGPAANQGVRLVPMSAALLGLDAGSEQATTATDSNGAFTFPVVPVGQYMLSARRIPGIDASAVRQAVAEGATAFSAVAGRSAFGDREALFAEQPLVVDRALTNLSVVLAPGYHATGHFEFHGSAPPPGPDVIQRMQVSLVSAEGRAAPGLAPGTTVTPDGRFTSARYQPGHMFVNVVVGGSLGAYRLQSVMLGGRSHDVVPFDLTGGDLDGLTIVFTDQPASLDVVVPNPSAPASGGGSTSTAPPALDAVLFVIPAQYRDWLAGGMAPRVSVTANLNGGRFSAPLLPGDYLATVVSSAFAAGPHDAAFYDTIARLGTHVTLNAGEHRSVDLAVVDAR